MELSENSRVWFFQNTSEFTEHQKNVIETALIEFLAGWKAHGASLFADFEFIHNRIVLVAVDEDRAMATGCSIDKLTHLFKALGSQLNIDFFNRTVVHYERNGEVFSTPLNQFWAMRKAELIDDETIVFDTTIRFFGEYKAAWRKKFKESWHAEAWGR